MLWEGCFEDFEEQPQNFVTGGTMRERIYRLAKGIVDADVPVLSVMPETIRDIVQVGEITGKELTITETQGRFIKGLIYSSNMRVRVSSQSFGGSRNRITYEVDGRFMSKEDVIEGAFYLVTNAGEKKVPFSFSAELGGTGKVMDALKEPADFATMARKDPGLALRLFEYQDFVEAPFMQNLHIRALYEGLRGRVNRKNQLEEFLVAIQAKRPAELEVDRSLRLYEKVEASVCDVLRLKTSGWGYLSFEIQVDGDFLEFSRSRFESEQFRSGVCEIPFTICYGKLHHGKNLGEIRICTVRQDYRIPVEVHAIHEDSRRKGTDKEAFGRYPALRLEFGRARDELLKNQIRQELDLLHRQAKEPWLGRLFEADFALLEGDRERAAVLLEECREVSLSWRGDEEEQYCFYRYLCWMAGVAEKDELSYRLERGLQRYPRSAVFGLLGLWMDAELKARPSEYLSCLEGLFRGGCRSPFLYAEIYALYECEPVLLRQFGALEMQVFSFATRHGWIGEELAVQAAKLSSGLRHYHRLGCRLLMQMYSRFPKRELLGAVCAQLIKGDFRGSRYFSWYQKALDESVSLTRLYEYYLYSLPSDYPHLLPKEVLLYFSYDRSLDDQSRSLLYVNILNYMNPESSIYRHYEREMGRFAMEQLLKSRIDSRLAVLYEHMLYRDMVDAQVAKVLPSLIRSYCIQIENPHIRHIVVCYEETEGEHMFPVREGVAYVPLFSRNPVILFQDEYGNRYFNISSRKLRVMDQEASKELEERCFEIFPEHPMLRLKECEQIVESGVSGPEEMLLLKRALSDLPLQSLFKNKVYACLITYYQGQMDRGQDVGTEADHLLEADLARLGRRERAGVCEALIHQDYCQEAFDVVVRYGWEGIRAVSLQKLCSSMILQSLFAEQEELLQLACLLFFEGRYDGAILDYLCEHFNGSTGQMFSMLNQGIQEHIERYDMPERLLAQMMFTGETDRIDQVFQWYVQGKNTSKLIVRAYFTMKSADYFLRERHTGDQVFAYLESAVQKAKDRAGIPTIYMMALTQYYSEQKSLNDRQKAICRAMVAQLVEEGRVFACFRKLGSLIEMPDAIMDKVIVEYRGRRDVRPQLEIRILPEEDEFSGEEMQKVYPGIYVRQKVLFEGETLEYRIYETIGEKRRLVSQGSLSSDIGTGWEETNRFAALNEMGLCLSLNEETALQEKMKNYLTDSAVMEALFGLM